jgi:Ca2+-binding RTX toxin-like protein
MMEPTMARIIGTTGNDALFATKFADEIKGDSGIDEVNYAASDAAVKIDLTAQIQHGGYAEGDALSSIENVVGSSFDDSIRGDGGSNLIDGGKGNDTLNGGGGADKIEGGYGDDVLTGGQDGIVDYLSGGEGSDWVSYASEGGYGVNVTLGANGSAGVGSILQVFLGTPIPVLTYVTEDKMWSIENVTGSQFADTITGNEQDNTLVGGGGGDTLSGGAGKDTVIGGQGADIMNGGTGADTFVFQATSDIGFALTAHDHIDSFNGTIDKIDLSAIDANTLAVGNQQFHLSGYNFDGTAGALRIQQSGGGGGDFSMIHLVSGDVNGDSVADFTLEVGATVFGGGTMTLAAGDFIL